MKLHALAATSRASTAAVRPEAGDPEGRRPHVGVQRRGPVVEHAPALDGSADSR